jgi:hypothetical protein
MNEQLYIGIVLLSKQKSEGRLHQISFHSMMSRKFFLLSEVLSNALMNARRIHQNFHFSSPCLTTKKLEHMQNGPLLI